jgi:hypothetical protein
MTSSIFGSNEWDPRLECATVASALRDRFKGSRPYKQKVDGPISSQPIAAEAQSAAGLVGVRVAA